MLRDAVCQRWCFRRFGCFSTGLPGGKSKKAENKSQESCSSCAADGDPWQIGIEYLGERPQQQLDGLIHAGWSLTGRHHGSLPAYERLLWQVLTRTSLLHPTDRAGDNRGLVNDGLLDLALHHADWMRPPEAWCPGRQNVWPQFSSLAHHLLARYRPWVNTST